ncbi:tRNA (N6-isopentenyl adenosine(37)-C2)-methylthiotransferase MiaB, partial [bacterium]
TISLFESVGYIGGFAFRYSVRPGTPAAKMKDSVPETEKIRRLKIIIEMIQVSAERFSESLIGKTREVLVEGESPRNPGLLFGFDLAGRRVLFPGNKDLRGKLVDIIIENANRWLLKGKIK